MTSLCFSMTSKMYEDIFEKRMPNEFFSGLRHLAGNSYKIELGSVEKKDFKGSVSVIFERYNMIRNILERYGCPWSEDGDDGIEIEAKEIEKIKKDKDKIQKMFEKTPKEKERIRRLEMLKRDQ